MAASAERGPEIGLGSLRNRGGLCGYVHRRARSGHVRGSNSATLESQFVDTSAEFARRQRSADDILRLVLKRATWRAHRSLRIETICISEDTDSRDEWNAGIPSPLVGEG